MGGEEEEVVAEVEAVKAVYGTDCVLLHSFPPHFHISLKPRTADVSSEQFVEVILEVRASPEYPKEPPCVDLVDCKGLDEQRQKHLLNYIRSKAYELSLPCLMLVALCERKWAQQRGSLGLVIDASGSQPRHTTTSEIGPKRSFNYDAARQGSAYSMAALEDLLSAA
ncbi:Ubiquitin-conjugating enzyme/RWD-like [Sesbania bispinosa]|nr:Ubiquitin-conjugating enzyme/RWD-like [Sesbania bispinosa]